MGCIQSGIDLNIIRLTYRDGTATSRLLPSEKIVPLMRDPLLRSTRVLQGLFDESVLVTESDLDRSFYDEVNHRLVRFSSDFGIPNCLFLNAQNWQTIARIIRPLRDLGVAAAAIADLDVVTTSDSTGFQAVLIAAGIPEGTRTALGQLRGNLKRDCAQAGADIKKEGIGAVAGSVRQDFDNFLKQLSKYGIFLVPVGELESWLPSLPGALGQQDAMAYPNVQGDGEDPQAKRM